ncbi:MAG: hypothetical protein U0520_00655 [Candidatus Saccharimonadales bacterium]
MSADIPLQNPNHLAPRTELWGNVTEPEQHNPQSYRYLVHAINPIGQRMVFASALSFSQEGIYGSADEQPGDQTVSLIDNPERVGDRVAVSMSLIDQDHTGTWGNAGLIVTAPEDNVILTHSRDVGTHGGDIDMLRKQSERYVKFDPDQLLAASSENTYNEVVGLGSTESGNLELQGFFIKVNSDGKPFDESLANIIRAHANRLKLPVVEIKNKDSVRETDVVGVENGDIKYVRLNGKTCVLKSSSDKIANFVVYGEDFVMRFASADQMQEFAGFLTAQVYDEATVANILKQYEEADNIRQTPKFEFDEDGTVKSLKMRTGYGLDESERLVGKTGFACWYTLEDQRRHFDQSLSGYTLMNMQDNYFQYLSPYEVDEMAKAALQRLEDLQRASAEEWLQTIRPTVIQNWDYQQQRSSSFL